MLRIPTGKIPKNTARTISILAGFASGIASLLWPAQSTLFRELGIAGVALGTALGGTK